MLKPVLAALLIALPGAALAEDWGSFYLKVYGGPTAADAQFAGVQDWDLDPGEFLGGSVGLATPVPGLALELDISRSFAYYVGEQNALDATLAMANVVYSLPLGAQASVYGGVGLGYAFVLDDCITSDIFDAEGGGAAGQVFIGAEVKVHERLSLFAEGRYQTALSRVTVTDRVPDTYGVDYARTALLMGVKINL